MTSHKAISCNTLAGSTQIYECLNFQQFILNEDVLEYFENMFLT
jgi:hypothetical protein